MSAGFGLHSSPQKGEKRGEEKGGGGDGGGGDQLPPLPSPLAPEMALSQGQRWELIDQRANGLERVRGAGGVVVTPHKPCLATDKHLSSYTDRPSTLGRTAAT